MTRMFPGESEKLAIKSVSSETNMPLATLYDNYYRLNDFGLFDGADEKGLSVNVTIATSLVSHVVLHASSSRATANYSGMLSLISLQLQ